MRTYKSKKLNNLYEVSLKTLLESDITSDKDLYRLAEKMDIRDLKICWLSEYDNNYKGPQIINLGSSSVDQTGTHWVCSFMGSYFDSFGMPPPLNLDHLSWTPLQLQDRTEGRCGQWCLMFILFSKKNELDRFYTLFKPLPSTKGKF